MVIDKSPTPPPQPFHLHIPLQLIHHLHGTETNKSNKDRISYSLDYNVIGLAHSIPPLPLVEKLQNDTAKELCSIGEI